MSVVNVLSPFFEIDLKYENGKYPYDLD